MSKSRKIATLLGPSLVATTVSEFPLVQPHLYDAQSPPVIYLSGVLLFVAGLAIVREHNLWTRDWTALVTVSGWFLLGLGLVRMFAAESYRQASANTSGAAFMVLEGILLVVGLMLSYEAYARQRSLGPDQHPTW